MRPLKMFLRGLGRLTGQPRDPFTEVPDLSGRTAIVTGASTGIGAEVARGLAGAGARVAIVGRHPERTPAVAARLRAETGAEVWHYRADFARSAEIDDLAAKLRELERIDILVHNAGVWKPQRHLTPDGIEFTLGVNHVAPYRLTLALMERLQRSATRVVVTSSRLHRRIRAFPFDDPMSRESYSGIRAYAVSKLANVLFATELHRRSGLQSFAVHPGDVATDVGRDSRIADAAIRLARPLLMTPREGAQTLLYAATSPALDDVGTGYLAECALLEPSPGARDAEAGKRLWDWTEQLIAADSPASGTPGPR